jgi:hypothetical protein
MGTLHRNRTWRGVQMLVLLAGVLEAPTGVHGAEPIEIVREAYRNSSNGLASGVGKGRYRHYEAVPGGDWQLKVDSSLDAHFEGRKYHIDLTFARDEIMGLDARRIIYDGTAITEASFTPNAHPTGADARVLAPQDDGSGLARLAWGEFPWDVTNLAKNVWDPEHLFKRLGAGRIEFKLTTDGDLVGSYSHSSANGEPGGIVRFECPRKFGFNLAREQVFNNQGQGRPARESNLQWKQNPNGLWYVTSALVTFEMSDDKGKLVGLVRAVIMYSHFEPNAKVDPSLFTEKSLQLPAGSPIVDVRPGAPSEIRRAR